VTVDVRSLVKLEAGATAFRLLVTVAAGLLGVAILAGVAETVAYTSAALLLVIAVVGPLAHGGLAVVLRGGYENALEATLIATAVLWLLDIGTTVAVHLQNVLGDTMWPSITFIVLVSIVHLVVLVQAGRAYAAERARATTEPEDPEEDAELGSEVA